MTDELETLSRRIVRAPHFRWIAGMRWRFDLEHHRNVWSRYMGSDLCDDDGNSVTESSPFDRTHDKRIIIDLSDPATKGCLLSLLREVYGQEMLTLVPMSGGTWGVAIPNVLREGPKYKSPTEAEAMVAALDGAA